MGIHRDELVGAWHLERFEITYSDERPPSYPFGDDARGVLIYSACGAMTATLSRAERQPLDVSRLETFSSASATQKADAFDAYLSYAGRWALDESGTSVTHFVELATVPNIIGREQVRRATLDGEGLILSYEVTARSGVSRLYRLRWLRKK